MYKKTCKVTIEDVPKNEPIDLYIMKCGSNLTAAAVTSTTYQAARVDAGSSIREVEDFTRICTEHEFGVIKDSEVPRKYNLEFEFDMRDTLCTVDEYPCVPAELPDQLVDCLAN